MSEPAAPATAPSPARIAVAVPVILALLLALGLLPVLLRPSHFIQDDSYFYLQIASHIAAGYGSTFHGITPTNGYHPLWMACIVPMMALAGGDKGVGLYLVVILQVLISAGTLLLFKRLADEISLDFWLPGVVVLAAYLLGTGIFGSEAHINALTLVLATLSLWRSISSQQDRSWLWTGMLFGAAVLARLDNVFVAGALLGFGLVHDRPRDLTRLVRRTALVGLGGTVVVAPYLLHNLLSYGHIMPISGAIKSVFPAATLDIARLGSMGRLAAPFGLVCLAIGLVFDKDRRRRVLWLGLGGGVVLHALYVVTATDHYTFWPWYYVSGVLAASLAVSYLTGWIAARIRPLLGEAAVRRLVLIAACVLLAGGSTRAWLKAFGPFQVEPLAVNVRINEYRWAEEFALWMKANLPRGSIVYAQDWPGAIAWYSDLTILPMDGLVNDFQYDEDLRVQGVERYLCSRSVDFVLGLVDGPAPHRLRVLAPLSRQPAGVLTLRPENLVVEAQAVLKRPEETLPFAIWRMPCTAS